MAYYQTAGGMKMWKREGGEFIKHALYYHESTKIRYTCMIYSTFCEGTRII